MRKLPQIRATRIFDLIPEKQENLAKRVAALAPSLGQIFLFLGDREECLFIGCEAPIYLKIISPYEMNPKRETFDPPKYRELEETSQMGLGTYFEKILNGEVNGFFGSFQCISVVFQWIVFVWQKMNGDCVKRAIRILGGKIINSS